MRLVTRSWSVVACAAVVSFTAGASAQAPASMPKPQVRMSITRTAVWVGDRVRFTIDIDWATLYGPEWAVLKQATPCSTILAAGSPVAVYTGKAVSDES